MAPDRGTCVHVAVTSQCPAIPTSDAPVPVVNRNKYVVETRNGLGCDSSLPLLGNLLGAYSYPVFSRAPQSWKEFWQQLLIVAVLFLLAYVFVSLFKIRW